MKGLLMLFASAFAIAACGGNTGSDSGGSGGSSASAGTSGSGGVAGSGAQSSGGKSGCESFVPCCDGSGNTVDPVCVSGFPECPAGSSFPSSGICAASVGCTPTSPCGVTEYCDYPDDLCGAGKSGTCKPRPNDCDLLYAPVCTCAGTVAGNDCSAYTSGSDLAAKDKCPAPAGTISCGPEYCDASVYYCQHSVSDVGGESDGWECKLLPTGCSPEGCACLEQVPCGQWCDGNAKSGLTVTCPGG